MKIDLQKQFDEYNAKYFNSRLHDVTVRWSKGKTITVAGEQLVGYCHNPSDLFKPNEIVLSKKLKYAPWMWKLVLLHECVHLDLHLLDQEEKNHHGPLFNKAMLRLAKKGAFNDIW